MAYADDGSMMNMASLSRREEEWAAGLRALGNGGLGVAIYIIAVVR